MTAARPRWVRLAALLLLLPALAWAAAVALLWWKQEALLFFPQALPAGTKLATEPDVHEHSVDVPGAKLSVLTLNLPEPRGVVFFLHGNAGNLQSWFSGTDFYRRAGFDLVMPDYRGYGKSTGRIESEAQLHADVMAVWRTFAPRYAGKRIVLYGRSLGTGLAAELAATVQPDLTVLVSPYASIAGLARTHYPWVPTPVLRYPLRTEVSAPRIRGPLLLVHGDRDDIIPFSESTRLQAAAPRAKLLRIEGGGHNDLQDLPAYRQAMADALATLP